MAAVPLFAWLDFSVGVLVIAELLLSGIVIFLGREWQGTRRGVNLDPRNRRSAYVASIALLIITIGNIVMIAWRLVRAPADLGNKDELSVTGAALGVMWWSDILCLRQSVRRRRRVADHLAQFPTFRFGHAGYNSPTSENFQESEFVVRSAMWTLFEEARERAPEPMLYWHGEVVRFFESQQARQGASGAVVLLFDASTQDEAGAELLTPSFSHVAELNKQLIASVVWRALRRSGVWNVNRWDRDFAHRIVSVLGDVRAVSGMRNGELWHNMPDSRRIESCPQTGTDEQLSNTDACELCTLLWAAIMVEVLDYLDTGKELNILPGFLDVPITVSSVRGATVSLNDACFRFQQLRP